MSSQMLTALLSLVVTTLGASSQVRPSHPATSGDSLQLVGRSAHLSLRAARELYTLPAHPDRCGVLLTLINETQRAIGVDLRTYWTAIYPSQWTLTRGPQRDLVDETVLPLAILTLADTQALHRAFRAGELTPLAPLAAVRVFTLFNGRCPEVSSIADQHYLILPLVGALRSTDGRRVAELRLTEAPAPSRDIVLPLPFVSRVLPSGILRLLPPSLK